MLKRISFIIVLLGLVGCDVAQRDRVQVSPAVPTADSRDSTIGELPAPDITSPDALPASTDANWQTVADGMAFREIPTSITTVQIVRVDPAVRRVRVAYDVGSPGRVSEWATALKPLLVVNGGYFDPQGRATALTIYDGVVAGESYQGFGGMLSVDLAGTLSLRSLSEQPYDTSEEWAQALQSAPMLVLNGEPVPQPNDNGERSRRTVVAVDNAGRMLVLVCTWPTFSLTELTTWLVDQDLGIVNALNLDGGSSTGMVLATDERSFTLDSLVRVPQVLVVE